MSTLFVFIVRFQIVVTLHFHYCVMLNENIKLFFLMRKLTRETFI